MPKYYDLYINNQWAAQYHSKKDAISDAKDSFDLDEVNDVEVIKCESYDFRDGGETVYEKHKR